VKMRSTSGTGFPAVQTPGTPFKIQIGNGYELTDEDAHQPTTINTPVCDATKMLENKCTIIVPNLSMCTVSIAACVHEDYKNAFDSLPGKIGGTSYCKGAEQEIRVEVADAAMPSAAQLWDGSAFQIDITKTNEGIVAPLLNTSATEFKNIYRGEVRRQVWLWSGRPVRPAQPPIADPQTTEEKNAAEEFELLHFGWRYDFDSIVMPMARLANGQLRYEENTFKNDLRSTYLRFSLRAYSRYAGILRNNAFVDATGPESEIWKSCLIPCRKVVNVKPPDLKLILPLTQSQPGESSPGLLVLLRGPWFQEGGLGEAIEAVVDSVANPEEAASTTYYFQYGIDPILATKENKGAPLDRSKANIEFKNIIGPIGHTFDVNSDDPLFVNTSFLLPAPSLSGQAAPHQPWNFCRLRLKRVIYLDHAGNRKAESAETSPHWVQFLPASSIFGKLDVSALKLSKNSGGQQLQFTEQDVPRTLEPAYSPQKVFTLYAVITQAVMDATGMQGQEEYVTVARQETDGRIWTVLGPALSEQATYRARVIEVQAGQNRASQPYQSADILWKSIFDDSVPDTDRARIVRISPPIESTSTQPSEVHVCRSLAAATS
jgi:hypothetical protein